MRTRKQTKVLWKIFILLEHKRANGRSNSKRVRTGGLLEEKLHLVEMSDPGGLRYRIHQDYIKLFLVHIATTISQITPAKPPLIYSQSVKVLIHNHSPK